MRTYHTQAIIYSGENIVYICVLYALFNMRYLYLSIAVLIFNEKCHGMKSDLHEKCHDMKSVMHEVNIVH
jgi:hypothetical protein